jgi:polysaccharide export outer membrane protein
MIKSVRLMQCLLLISLFACKSVPDDLIMFDNLNKGAVLSNVEINDTNYESLVIEPENTLSVTVSSADVRDYELKEQFNILPLTSFNPITARVTGDMAFQNYRVDANGEIDYPVFGKIKVAGLTNIEVEQLLLEKLKTKLTAPQVRVYVDKESIKIFGEVGNPGIQSISKRHFSIIDALANAGGITANGDKKHVKLIREENGQLTSVMLDMTSTDIFSSPYFYLKQKDIIVVDPNHKRLRDSLYGSADNYRLSIISTIIGAVSTIVSIIVVATN